LWSNPGWIPTASICGHLTRHQMHRSGPRAIGRDKLGCGQGISTVHPVCRNKGRRILVAGPFCRWPSCILPYKKTKRTVHTACSIASRKSAPPWPSPPDRNRQSAATSRCHKGETWYAASGTSSLCTFSVMGLLPVYGDVAHLSDPYQVFVEVAPVPTNHANPNPYQL